MCAPSSLLTVQCFDGMYLDKYFLTFKFYNLTTMVSFLVDETYGVGVERTESFTKRGYMIYNAFIFFNMVLINMTCLFNILLLKANSSSINVYINI